MTNQEELGQACREIAELRLFDNELKYTTGECDKLAVFDGNILVVAQSNASYDGVKTILTLAKTIKPSDKLVGDWEDDATERMDGHAFHFNTVASVDVVINALLEIKESMLAAKAIREVKG